MDLQNLINEDPKKGLFRVHRSALTSQEILELERKNIFDRCWLYLGHESEIPDNGDFLTRDVGGRELIFVRDKHGQARAFFNTERKEV